MDESDLKARTKLFARRVLKLVEALPRTRSGNHGQFAQDGGAASAEIKNLKSRI